MTSGIYPRTMPQKFTFLIFPLHVLLYINKVKKKTQRPSALLFRHNRMYLQYFRTFDLSDIPECFLEAPVGMCSAHQPQMCSWQGQDLGGQREEARVKHFGAGRGRTWGGGQREEAHVKHCGSFLTFCHLYRN